MNVVVGDTIVVAGVTDTGFNGTFTIATLVGTTITYAQTAADASSSGGTVTAQSTTAVERVRIDSAGNVGIGSTTITNTALRISKNITGSNSSYALYLDGSAQADVTSNAFGIRTNLATQATSFTLPNLFHFNANQGTFGAGSTVTNQFGFTVDSSLTGATNNYGFYGNIASGTGRWNLYMSGTANNYMAGNVGIGTTAPLTALNVNGTGGELIRISVTADVATIQEPALGFATGVTNTHPATKISALEFDASDSRASMLFYTRDTNSDVAPTERMRIDSSGNVGVGTTAPQQRLGVKPATNVPQLYLIQDNVANDGFKLFADSSAGYLSFLRTSSGSDTERMRISSAGVVTAPYQPCFHAYRTTTQTGTNPFAIIFDTAPVNVGSSYSTSTGRFTAPVTGNYFLLFHSIGLASAWSTFLDIFLYKNGSSAPLILSNRPASTNGSEVPASLATSSAICNLTAGDYVEIRVIGTSIYSDGNAWLKFMGFLIG